MKIKVKIEFDLENLGVDTFRRMIQDYISQFKGIKIHSTEWKEIEP